MTEYQYSITTNHFAFFSLKVLLCLILSFVIIYPILGFRTIEAILSFILLFLLFIIIVYSTSAYENSTIYPYMPHTGLDGISSTSYYAGKDV